MMIEVPLALLLAWHPPLKVNIEALRLDSHRMLEEIENRMNQQRQYEDTFIPKYAEDEFDKGKI